MDTSFINRYSSHALCAASMREHTVMHQPLLSAMLHCHAHMHKQQIKANKKGAALSKTRSTVVYAAA